MLEGSGDMVCALACKVFFRGFEVVYRGLDL